MAMAIAIQCDRMTFIEDSFLPSVPRNAADRAVEVGAEWAASRDLARGSAATRVGKAASGRGEAGRASRVDDD